MKWFGFGSDKLALGLTALRSASATVWSWFKPAFQLWPWLTADVVFTWYLAYSSQGQGMARDFADAPPAWWSLAFALVPSFLLTLTACLVTALVLAIRADVVKPRADGLLVEGATESKAPARKDGRPRALLVTAWTFALAGWPALAVAWTTGLWRPAVVVGMTAAMALVTLSWTLRGAWRRPERWHKRLSELRGYRYALGGLVVALATGALLVGANQTMVAPSSPRLLGAVLVPILGLSALSTLFGGLFVTFPQATRHPWFLQGCVLAIAGLNLTQLPLTDDENSLLKQSAETTTLTAQAARSAGMCKLNEPVELRDLQDRVMYGNPPPLPIPDKPAPVWLVSAEGGGIRAAYWAALVSGRADR